MDNQKSEAKQGRWIGINIVTVLALLLADQISKYWAAHYLKAEGPIVILKEWFELHYLENKGAAWGMLNGKVWFLILFTMVMILGLLYLINRIPNNRRYNFLRVSMLCIIAGAIGNLLDRVLYGYVVDFLYFKKINFPIFNIADIYVTVGAAIFCILFLFVYKDEELTFWSLKKNHKQMKENGE